MKISSEPGSNSELLFVSRFELWVCSSTDGDAAKCEFRLRLRSRDKSRTSLALRSLVVGEGVMLVLLLNYHYAVVMS